MFYTGFDPKTACIAVLVVAWIVLSVAIAFGSPLDCEQLRDPDQRHMCRAQPRGDKSECELIKRTELRIQCRARVK